MTIRNANGDRITKTQFAALMSAVPNPATRYTVTEEVFQDYNPTPDDDSASGFESSQRKLFVPGASTFTQADVDALFAAATFGSISPATGGTAGGTAVTIKGTNLAGLTGVTFGGTAATAVVVHDATTVTCVTPAKTAGAVAVVLQDDSGNVSTASAFTYA